MKNINLIIRSALVVALVSLVAGLTACNKPSVVSDSPATTQAPAAQPQTATQSQTAAQPAEQAAATQAAQSAAQQPSPSPTLHPLMKQAQANPGVPVTVPESMRRPLNAEEMKKAMEAMPPAVRAQLQGMAQTPQGAKPTATPKQ